MTPTDRITPAMLRELKSIATTGEPTDPIEWHGANALWFHARDRVIGALDRRGLIAATPDWTVTDAGRAAIAWAHARVVRSEVEANSSLAAQAEFRAHVARVLAPRAKA